jgi:arabinose-5-phosphate isomerase
MSSKSSRLRSAAASVAVEATALEAAPEPGRDAGARDDIAVARRVIATEIDGLAALARALDATFVAAVDLMAKVRGRIIVTGMGKSGHVARKVAATLASTGTPAQYVHPAEASHGDLGMITRADAVLAFSNSGETAELSDLVAYAKFLAIPLIGVTGRAGSTLATAADASLVVPGSDEACPMNLAPTTSTTVMMALGDAIAVSLLERRGFSPDHFAILHPGGQLGRRFIKVADIMHGGEAMPLLPDDATMAEALIEMTAKSFGCVGIVARRRLVGIITDGDLRRHMDARLPQRAVVEVMTRTPRTIAPAMLAAQALGVMNERKITSLFVVEHGRPVGILHIHDCLRAGVV